MSAKDNDHKKPHHPKSEKFVFSCDSGTVTIPYLENVPRKLMREVRASARNGDDADDILFGALLNKKDLAVLESMTLGEYDNFTDEWNEKSAVQMGE